MATTAVEPASRIDEPRNGALSRAIEAEEPLTAAERALVTDQAIQRWAGGLEPHEYSLRDIARLERERLASLQTLRDGIELTDSEWKLWRYLARHEGKVRSYLQIAQHMWGSRERPITPAMMRGHHGYQSPWVNHIQNLISIIRKKTELDPLRPMHLATIRGVGYIFHARPPAKDDGVDYAARATEAAAMRFELRTHFGLVFDEEEPPLGWRPRIELGPEHPDYAAGVIEGRSVAASSRPAER